MTGAQCSCGFRETRDVTITDHLLGAFAPDDDRGCDGRVHLEGESPLACLCGFVGTAADELDRHFLAVFAPASSVGRDELRHEQRQS
jgi:hypothetical protein